MSIEPMDMPVLQTQPRIASGKSEARRLRATGMIPAVAYGKELKALSLSVSPKDVLNILKTERGKNNVIKMTVTGADGFLSMIRDFSYHPVTRKLEHVDFVEVKLDKAVTVEVPLVVHGKAAGVVMGGVLHQVFRTLPVTCVPGKIPLKIEVDVTPLNLNEHIATRDLKLAPGVKVALPEVQTLVSVVAPEKERGEEVPVAGAGAAAASATPAPAAKEAKAAPAKKK